MSATRAVVALAAAVVVYPIATHFREIGATGPGAAPAASAAEPQASPADVRAFLEGVRGANAIQCEMILQSFHAWSNSVVPDRDSAAHAVSLAARRPLATAQSVTDLVAALRGDDECAARAAARMLGRSRLSEARTALLASLGNGNAEVRRLAAIGLGFSSDTTLSLPLVRALGDQDAEVRAAVAWALGAVR